MKIINSHEYEEIKNFTCSLGIDEKIIIDEASEKIYDIVKDFRPKRVLVIAGKGFKGAVVISLARKLNNFNIKTDLAVLYEDNDNPVKNELFLYNSFNFKHFIYKDFNMNLNEYDIIIDGIFGEANTENNFSYITEKINSSGIPVISADYPSGLNPDNGETLFTPVKAFMTVTFNFLKPVHIFLPGKLFCGSVKIADLCFSDYKINQYKRELVTFDTARNFLPKRFINSNKYDYGKITIIGGSPKYPGAPFLSASGALRTGTGLVEILNNFFCGPATDTSVINSYYKELFSFSDEAKAFIDDSLKNTDCILLGPGLEKNSEKTVRYIIEKYKNSKKIVIDATAINFTEGIELSDNIVLTPHSGEMKKLVPDFIYDDRERVEKYASDNKCTVVYKSYFTLITDGNNSYVNILGNNSLSKGGSGDLLSGVIAGFCAQGLSAGKSSVLGSYIVYKTALELTEKYTEYYITPELISQNIYKTLSDLKGVDLK